jgi:hypothetical protein
LDDSEFYIFRTYIANGRAHSFGFIVPFLEGNRINDKAIAYSDGHMFNWNFLVHYLE